MPGTYRMVLHNLAVFYRKTFRYVPLSSSKSPLFRPSGGTYQVDFDQLRAILGKKRSICTRSVIVVYSEPKYAKFKRPQKTRYDVFYFESRPIPQFQNSFSLWGCFLKYPNTKKDDPLCRPFLVLSVWFFERLIDELDYLLF